MVQLLQQRGEEKLKDACVVLHQMRKNPECKELSRWVARLIRILCSLEPLVCFLPPTSLRTVRSVLAKQKQATAAQQRQLGVVTNEEAQLLSRFCPFLQQFLSFLAARGWGMPLPLIELIEQACDRADQQQQSQQQPPQQQQQQRQQQQEQEQRGCYYGLPSIRRRPNYVGVDEVDSVKKSGCSKSFAQFSGISGGCMVLWCPHRVALGFHVIPSAEGRNDVFSAIFTRWPTAPAVICYDFACALQPYCFAREPGFFTNTTFVIDRLHSKNHSACSEVFDLENFRLSGDPTFFFNDVAHEQGNKGLDAIRTSCLYMRLDRFVPFVKLHLETANCKVQAKMRAK